MRKFNTFTELTEDFARRDGTALEFTGPDGSVCNVSYRELADMIFRRAEELRQRGSGTDIVCTSIDVESVVEVFASAVACRCILMSDARMPEKVLNEAAAAADRLICDVTEHAGDGEMLFFTSGTTNRSKVVRLTSRTMCCSAWSGQSMLACGEGDKILCLLPLSHVFGFVCGLLWGLTYGATVCLCGPEDRQNSLQRFRPTILPVVPAGIERLLALDSLNPELRIVLIGAAPCSEEAGRKLREKGIEIYYGYGLTETSSGIAITQDHDEPFALHLCPGADVRIEFDGEISVSTPCMMKGYLGQPETDENFRLLTGDLGYLDEKGRLHLQGRKKDVLIMSDGTKLNCLEYEHDIAEMSGETDIALIEQNGKAVLIAGAGADLERLREVVTEYNKTMMTTQRVFRIEEFGRPLPRTMTGKIRRYELLRRYQ